MIAFVELGSCLEGRVSVNGGPTYLPEHGDAEDDLSGIVGDEDAVQLEGLPVGHEAGTQDHNQVQVHCYHQHRGDRAVHEGPVVHPGVCNISRCSGTVNMS